MATDRKLIESFPCFSELSDDQLDAIAQISNSVCYMEDHILFEEGQAGDYLYLLIDGDVEVFYHSPETGEVKVDIVSNDEVVGCAAFVPPYKYTATEKCLSDVEVLEIEIDELQKLIDEDPQIGLKLQQHIIKTLNERILALRKRAFN